MDHKIKTFEDACVALGKDAKKLQAAWQAAELAKDTIAYEKLKIIIEALNEGWKPDWDNGQWDKYYPWFWMSSSRGFSFGVYGADRDISFVGSRLCFKSDELAEYAATQFVDLYRDYMVIE